MLLDTHTFLWAIFEPERLSKAVRSWLTNPDMALHLSVASVWEMELKHRKGKLNADASLVDANIQDLGVFPLPISLRHVRALGALNGSAAAAKHKDPFDRLIAAQAIAEKLPLVTADPVFAEYSDIRVRW
ncbi:MAG: type II toxin-antitoxin system VapC family toxin [Bryobacteraceae bacterium]